MIDYQVFETAEPYSPEWNATEIVVLSRAFELKRLTVVSRGKRKNHIQIASPGESLSSRPNDLENGVLEWAITYEAFEAYRRFRPIQEAIKGIFAIYLNPNPIYRVSNPIFKEVSQTLGWEVGFAVALWNDIGSVWPDLWDYYSTDNTEVADPAYQPFLNFFRVVQSARLSWEDTEGYSDMAQSVIEGMLRSVTDIERKPFAQDSAMISVLLSVGVSQEKIDSLRGTINIWPKTENILSLLDEYDRLMAEFEESVEQKDSSDSGSRLFAKDDPDELRSWNAAGKLLESKHIEEQIKILLEILYYSGVEINFHKDVPGLGKFDIKILESDRELDIHSSIDVRYSEEDDTSPYRLALCHEIGHFVHHSSWMIELRLADLAIKHLYHKNIQTATQLTFLRQNIHKDLVQNYSAMETAADEFAVNVLMPERVRKVLVDFCSTQKGFRSADFLGVALDMLGIGVGGKNLSLYGSRFINIIDDKMPHDPTTPSVAYGENLRRIRLLASKRRVEHLFDSFWSNSLAIIAGSSTRSTSRSRASIRSEFYFEGIVCK